MADDTQVLDAEPTAAEASAVEPEAPPVVKDATPLQDPLYCKAVLEKSDINASGEEVFYFVATTEVEDRQGEIVTLDGWETDAFMANPVFLWVHDYTEPPIGRIVSIERTAKGMVTGVVFDEEDEFAQKIKSKYKRKFLNAVSVGFTSLERTGGRMSKEPVKHTRKSLLELSGVPVPANPEALAIRMAGHAKRMAEVLAAFKEISPAPEPDTKAGRVLSRANEAKLRQCVDALGMAHEMLAAVLAQVSSSQTDEAAPLADASGKATEPDATVQPAPESVKTFEADIGAILAFLGRKE